MRCTRDIRFGTVTYHSPLPTVSVLGGPGQLYLANPYTVAASAIAGYITTWEPGKVLAET